MRAKDPNNIKLSIYEAPVEQIELWWRGHEGYAKTL